jgi:hypothetical protein
MLDGLCEVMDGKMIDLIVVWKRLSPCLKKNEWARQNTHTDARRRPERSVVTDSQLMTQIPQDLVKNRFRLILQDPRLLLSA